MSALAVVPELPARCWLYLRISEDRTGQEAGVDRQEAECRAMADQQGWEVIDVLTDNDVSAFSGKRRPGYERLLGLIEQGEVDAIVAWHPDRLYRRSADLVRLVDAIDRQQLQVRTVRAGLVDLTTATGRFQARIVGAAAEYESELKGERVAASHRQRAAAGLSHGGPRPYGYDLVPGQPGHLVLLPDEAAVIIEAAQRVLAGESIRGVCLDFTRRGIPTVRGGPWRPKALADMLRSPRIAGLRPIAGEPGGPATWDPIVDRATWERVRAMLTNPPRGRQPRRHLLAGTLYCGRCGARLYSNWRARVTQDGTKTLRPGYQCRPEEPGACGRLQVVGEPLEAMVVEAVLTALRGADVGALRADAEHAVATLVADDEAMLAELSADMAARRITRAEWLSARAVVDERLKANRQRLARNRPSILDELGDPVAGWATLSFEQRRALIAMLISRVVIAPNPNRGAVFQPDRVTIEWVA
jgi:DNA invertase Pin-like site-specific DNA recombinase